MSVAVVVPFTSDEPWRARARDHTVGWYRDRGYTAVEGACGPPWRKAAAVADALDRTAADVLVVADADCLSRPGGAVTAVHRGAPWAIPHLMVHRLDVDATEAVYAGADPAATTGRTQRPYKGFAGGGIVIVSRSVYERVPLDPRFEGWGGEDSSWAMALTCMVGPPVRFDHDLFHLWHPPASRTLHRWGSAASRTLEIRYKRAARNRRQMADLLAEVAHTPTGAVS